MLDLIREMMHKISPHNAEKAFVALLENGGNNFGDWGDHVKHWSNCTDCKLHRHKKTSCVLTGNVNAKIMVIGEAPGPTEDINGIIFSGKTGTFLRETLEKIGYNVKKDLFFSNAVACCPKDHADTHFRKPMVGEIARCSSRISEQIALLSNLSAILILGKSGYMAWRYSLDNTVNLKNMETTVRMRQLLGWQSPNVSRQIPTYVTYHPSFIERERIYSDKTMWLRIMQAWIYDLAAVKKYIDTNQLISPRSK